MLFNSIEFFIFLPVVVILYALVPIAIRWAVLLVASYYFYMSWKWEYGLLIFSTTLLNYVAARWIEVSEGEKRRKTICLMAVSITLGCLFIFKYLGFAIESVNSITSVVSGQAAFDPVQLILPVGISFFTFQTLSYTIDVYRRDYHAINHLGKFALFISFFPQLVAGPIERPQNLLPQILSPPPMCPAHVATGAQLILWGMIKKVVIADHLAIYVNAVYNNPGSVFGAAVILATLLFSIQIYCDFSGYSDIAIGCAAILGIGLMQNFRHPYFATSLQDFWRRWHISLSTWFRDYVYIPLGGNRGGAWLGRRNLLVTFVISGVWHGAAWTFVIWGAIHGLVMVIEQAVKNTGRSINGVTGWLGTMLVVNFAWVFFRSNQLSDVPVTLSSAMQLSQSQLFLPSVSKFDCLLCPALAIGLLVSEHISGTVVFSNAFKENFPFRCALYATGVTLIATLGVFGQSSEFIYFRF